jgi:hypothetical protein
MSLLVVVGLTVVEAFGLIIVDPMSSLRLLRFFTKFKLLLIRASKDPLNLLYKPFAKHLRISNQFKAHRSGFAPENKRVVMLAKLREQRTYL